MFAVTKDVTALVFTATFASALRSEDVKRIEDDLTERIGVRCVLIDDQLSEGSDFKLKFLDKLPKQPKEPAEEPREVLDKEPGDEGHKGNDCLHKENPVLAFCKAVLRFGPYFLAVAAFFFLGCLTAFLLKF